MIIDVDKLREDLKREAYGAFWGGRYGGAMMESFNIDSASPEELVEIALRRGVDLSRYAVE